MTSLNVLFILQTCEARSRVSRNELASKVGRHYVWNNGGRQALKEAARQQSQPRQGKLNYIFFRQN